MREPCPDPGINANAEIAIAQHRRVLAECENKRALAVQTNDLNRAGFGLKPKEK